MGKGEVVGVGGGRGGGSIKKNAWYFRADI